MSLYTWLTSSENQYNWRLEEDLSNPHAIDWFSMPINTETKIKTIINDMLAEKEKNQVSAIKNIVATALDAEHISQLNDITDQVIAILQENSAALTEETVRVIVAEILAKEDEEV